MKIKNLITLLLLSLSFLTFSQESDAGGPPKLSELIGFWKKVELTNESELK